MKKIAIVTGMIVTYPFGGVFWDYAQYIIGLKRLGFDVYYIEDTGQPAYISHPDKYLKNLLELFVDGMENKWHYRSYDNMVFGISTLEIEKIVKKSCIFLNVSGACLLRDIYERCENKVLIDTDPGFNHFVNFPEWDKNPGWQNTFGFRGHDHFFTYAENFGNNDCLLPDLSLDWHTTKPLVIEELWGHNFLKSDIWTTVMSWNTYKQVGKLVEYNGRQYGAKEIEFKRVENIPLKVNSKFKLAIAGKDYPKKRWEMLNWMVIDAISVTDTPEKYQKFIQNSRGEFSIAKNVYVDTRSGWFSCRSICYMAASKPVVLQDTGFSKFIPTGKGVLAFSNLEEAVEAIKSVEVDYDTHSKAAKQIAKDYFGYEVVLKDMLTKIGIM